MSYPTLLLTNSKMEEVAFKFFLMQIGNTKQTMK